MYPHYVAKLEKKSRTADELRQVITWLTGYDDTALQEHLTTGTTFADFFAGAHLNPAATTITGSVCGVKVQDVEDPLMRQIRYLDKLVDELAKGRPPGDQPSARGQSSHPAWAGLDASSRPSTDEISTMWACVRTAIRVPSGDQARLFAQSKCRSER